MGVGTFQCKNSFHCVGTPDLQVALSFVASLIFVINKQTKPCYRVYTYKNTFQKSLYVGDLQDGGGIRCGDHLPPHKYIKNTSMYGTTPTEHLLNAGRRSQTSQKARNSPRTWVGQKKKKKKQRQKNRDGTCTSGREL